MSKFFSKLKYGFYRLLGSRPKAILNSKIDKKAKVGRETQFVNSTIGKYSYVYGSKIVSTDIGSFCSIAENCVIGGGKHPIDWVSSSPVFYKGKNCLKKNFSQNEFIEYEKTIIGNDVWVGSKTIIKGGVKIGDGAIIGMGSVVTHDVPEYEIWAGNPAKLIRKRFPDESIQKLLSIKWWDWDEKTLKKHANVFNNPEKFFEDIEK